MRFISSRRTIGQNDVGGISWDCSNIPLACTIQTGGSK